MNTILVVAPHPDDETLGCGGMLHKAVKRGDAVHWLICTQMTTEQGYKQELIDAKLRMIEAVAKHIGFDSVTTLDFPPSLLDSIDQATLIDHIAGCVKQTGADTLLLPNPSDAHSDHRIIFDAASSCSKWFRYPQIKKVLIYETPSETGFGIDPTQDVFRPNHYENISETLDDKIASLKLYPSELADFPFPRSIEAVTALAKVRGSESGYLAAEGYMQMISRHD